MQYQLQQERKFIGQLSKKHAYLIIISQCPLHNIGEWQLICTQLSILCNALSCSLLWSCERFVFRNKVGKVFAIKITNY